VTLITGASIHDSTTRGLNAEMSPENAIDGTGLAGGVPSLTGSHAQSFDTNWWSGWDGAVTEWQLTVDLEDTYDVEVMHVWNYREGCCSGRGLRDVEIYVSPDEDEANLVKLITDGTGLHANDKGGFLLPQAPTGGEYFGFDLDVSGVTNSALLDNVRLFRIDGGSSLHGGGEVHGGLGEIQFDGVPAVAGPEFLELLITPSGEDLIFSWEGREGKVYDLVSSADLMTPVIDWEIYGVFQNIVGAPTVELTTDAPDTDKLFFAIIERDPG